MNEILNEWNVLIKSLENDIDEDDIFSYRNNSIERDLNKCVVKLMALANNQTALEIALRIKSNKMHRMDKKLKHFKSLYFGRKITFEQFDNLCSNVERDMKDVFELLAS